MAKGVTVVTQELNKPFFERVWARPRARSRPTTTIEIAQARPRSETVSDKKVMTDGNKTIEIYFMKGTSHNVANMLVYMPKEGLVFWGDGYNPPEGNDPRDFGRTPEQMIDLYRVITMNNLDVKTVAPAHGFGPKPVRQSQEGDRIAAALTARGRSIIGSAAGGDELFLGERTPRLGAVAIRWTNSGLVGAPGFLRW